MTEVALVTGGTGTLGRLVVPRLQEAGWKVRVLSRGKRLLGEGVEHVAGDLDTGEGVEAAAAEAAIVIHCAGAAKGDDVKARSIVQAASHAGVRHLVNVSVVGADRIPVLSAVDRAMFGYFASKLAAERVIAASDVPWTTLRATQFHDLVLMVARQMARLPVVPLPVGVRFQPVDAGEVAARLVELVLGEPVGLAPDIAGPRIYGVRELLREYLRVTHRRRPMVPLWLPGKAAQAVRAGANLAPERAVGQRTWEEFLAEQAASAAPVSA